MVDLNRWKMLCKDHNGKPKVRAKPKKEKIKVTLYSWLWVEKSHWVIKIDRRSFREKCFLLVQKWVLLVYVGCRIS